MLIVLAGALTLLGIVLVGTLVADRDRHRFMVRREGLNRRP